MKIESTAVDILTQSRYDGDEHIPLVNDEAITPRQKGALVQLIYQNIGDRDERERWLSETDSLSQYDASEMFLLLS